MESNLAGQAYPTERSEKVKSKGFAMATLAYMFAMAETIGDYRPFHKSEPHYFNYSGIPTADQLRKREERKARKKAKKRRGKVDLQNDQNDVCGTGRQGKGSHCLYQSIIRTSRQN